MSNVVLKEQYRNGEELMNFVIYQRPSGEGNDQVLQHMFRGVAEAAHLTLHPNGSVNFRAQARRPAHILWDAVTARMAAWSPVPSPKLKAFLAAVAPHLPPRPGR